MSLTKRLKNAWLALRGQPLYSPVTIQFGVDLKRCNECDYKTGQDFRDHLLVVAGSRAAYMHDTDIIDIPSGTEGELELSKFIARAVDEYLEYDKGNFDLWIEEALMKAFSTNREKGAMM